MRTIERATPALREDTTRPAALLMREVTKVYDGAVTALDRVTLAVPRGSFLAVTGPAGSGKSALMHCAAGLDEPTSGEVWIGGSRISGIGEAKRAMMRRHRVGFVFQSYNLLPSLTVEENLTMALRLSSGAADRGRPLRLAERVGIAGLLRRRPGELTAGQRQRAAIARALAARPEVVFADEPTGALDAQTAAAVLDLLRELVEESGQTVVMVTRDPAAAARAHATAVVTAGRIDRFLDRPGEHELAALSSRPGEGELAASGGRPGEHELAASGGRPGEHELAASDASEILRPLEMVG